MRLRQEAFTFIEVKRVLVFFFYWGGGFKKLVLKFDIFVLFSNVQDLEDIFLTLDLELSRAEVKKLASKLAGAKDHVNYRVLTDVEVGSPEQVYYTFLSPGCYQNNIYFNISSFI